VLLRWAWLNMHK